MSFKFQFDYGKVILRISLSLVFLFFGISQIYNPASWTGFVPSFVSSIITPGTAILINGFVEIFFGLLLIFGLYTRFSSLILGLHLFGIAFSIGFNPLGIRDFGLALATLSIFFSEPDKLCLDEVVLRKTSK
ncbi:DoxX family protein [Candidatus Pacearchaeota archaeon]|nr:DoxX family protein [Candidatus Pacearchaeota archaeon]